MAGWPHVIQPVGVTAQTGLDVALTDGTGEPGVAGDGAGCRYPDVYAPIPANHDFSIAPNPGPYAAS